LDKESISINIEKLRSELTKEYEECFEKGIMDSNVIDISQRLDELILDYQRLNLIKHR